MSSALSISGLTKSYTKHPILTNMDINIPYGQIYAFLGPNGAGKSTTIRCMMGFEDYIGSISFLGGHRLNNTIRKQVGYAADTLIYREHMTGLENILMYIDYAKSIRNMDHISYLFQMFGLTFAMHTLVSNYSFGMKKRLGLIASMIFDPELLVRDEPMSGLDPLARDMVKQVMNNIRSQGKTIFFSTHILPDVAQIADSFGILCKGNIVLSGNVSDYEDLEQTFIHTIYTHQPDYNVS